MCTAKENKACGENGSAHKVDAVNAPGLGGEDPVECVVTRVSPRHDFRETSIFSTRYIRDIREPVASNLVSETYKYGKGDSYNYRLKFRPRRTRTERIDKDWKEQDNPIRIHVRKGSWGDQSSKNESCKQDAYFWIKISHHQVCS